MVIVQHQGKIAGLQPEMAVHNVGTRNVVGEQQAIVKSLTISFSIARIDMLASRRMVIELERLSIMLKFMAWFSAFVTIGFIVLMVFDYG